MSAIPSSLVAIMSRESTTEANVRHALGGLCVALTVLVAGCASADPIPAATAVPELPTIVRPPLATLSADAPSPAPSPARSVDTYTVQPGDTLTTIAERLFGNAAEWSLIYEANRDRMASPDALLVGLSLRIPSERARTPTPAAE
ncbi:MAG: LysM peptidoglycan-binding domain-containing protein [Chloroflexi bacterium]|nr:LysM peptidoglycan-binding domain-containing protein [Chloroflexota bacterium]